MNIKPYIILKVCTVLLITPLAGSGCQMLSQTAAPEPDKKSASIESKSMLIVTHIIGSNKNPPANDELSMIAMKSMQIAENMAQKKDTQAKQHQQELQNLIEGHFNDF